MGSHGIVGKVAIWETYIMGLQIRFHSQLLLIQKVMYQLGAWKVDVYHNYVISVRYTLTGLSKKKKRCLCHSYATLLSSVWVNLLYTFPFCSPRPEFEERHPPSRRTSSSSAPQIKPSRLQIILAQVLTLIQGKSSQNKTKKIHLFTFDSQQSGHYVDSPVYRIWTIPVLKRIL